MGKKVFKLEDYAGSYVMHCDTEDKSKVFLEFLHIQGRMWKEGDITYKDKTNWNIYNENTVYYFNNGTYGHVELVRYGRTVLEFDDFILK